MTFTQHSGIIVLHTEQVLKADIETVWDFFSNPENLNKLSPKDIKFRITSPKQETTYAGQIITYQIQLFPLVKFNWVTEITQVKDKHFFIDEQRFGPYRMWHHEHIFEPCENGTKMIDKVSFKLPFGWLGRMMFYLFIRRKLNSIFTYRATNSAQLLNA